MKEMLPCHFPELVTPEFKKHFSDLRHKLKEICNSVANNRDSFQRKQTRLRSAVHAGKGVDEVLTSYSDFRPLLDLWRTSSEFLRLFPPTKNIFSHVDALLQRSSRRRLGRLALRDCCLLFFVQYDQLGAALPELCHFIRRHLATYTPKEFLFGLDVVAQERNKLFTITGHEYLVDVAQRSGKTLVDAMKYRGISQFSRFYQASFNIFYITRLRKLPANTDDNILREVQRRDVYTSPLDSNGKRLGNAVLEILIEILIQAGQKPSELWRATLLSIGGDPRVPHTENNFRYWWASMKEAHLQKMYEWLSEMDMELFLKIMKEFIARSGDRDMQRMFPGREFFLRGLFKKKGLVKGTRLFLGRKPEDYLLTILGRERCPYFTRIASEQELTVFYVNLGTAHVVEGSHNFALTITEKLPTKSVFTSYDAREVPRRKLGLGLLEDIEAEFGSLGDRFLRKPHQGDWIYDVFAILQRLRVPVSESDIMDRSSYVRMYK